jgi:hypothetical protein
MLAARVPSLLNSMYGLTSIDGVPVTLGPAFNENMPFRDQPPLVNSIPGALDIHVVLDRSAWIGEEGDPLPFSALLRRVPLAGTTPRPFLIQIARADQTNPLPAVRNIIRAGALEDRIVLYRHDLFWPTAPSMSKNSHAFPLALPQEP